MVYGDIINVKIYQNPYWFKFFLFKIPVKQCYKVNSGYVIGHSSGSIHLNKDYKKYFFTQVVSC